MGYVLVAAAAMAWGCWALFLGPAGLTGAQSAWVLFVVMSLPAPFVLPRLLPSDRAAVWALGILGVADAANAAMYFAAISRGPLAVAVLTHYLAPLLVAGSAPFFLGETSSKRAMVAAPVSLMGLALLVGAPGDGFPIETAVLGAGSAVFYAVIVLTSKLAARAFTPLQITALHAPISAAVLLAVFGGSALPPWEPRTLWAVAGAAVCGVAANVLFNTGLRRTPTPSASALTYLEPVMAATIGAVVLGERLGLAGLLGAAAVVVSGVFVAFERPRTVSASAAP